MCCCSRHFGLSQHQNANDAARVRQTQSNNITRTSSYLKVLSATNTRQLQQTLGPSLPTQCRVWTVGRLPGKPSQQCVQPAAKCTATASKVTYITTSLLWCALYLNLAHIFFHVLVEFRCLKLTCLIVCVLFCFLFCDCLCLCCDVVKKNDVVQEEPVDSRCPRKWP